ncbi:MAG: S8 family serine peptidase [Chthoniobacterales bacterium]
MAITQAFRAAVEQEHPTRVNDLLPLDSGMIQNPRYLSSASLKNILGKIQPEENDSDSDLEGNTSQESMNMSNRSSESSERGASLTNTPLENALKLLQAREKEWNRAHPDRVNREEKPLLEDNHSLSKVATVFQDSKYNAFLEQVINKIEFAANQYLEAEAAYSEGDGSTLDWHLKSIGAAQCSASQYIMAAESLSKAGESDAHDLLVGTAWRGVAEARESAGRYYWQEAEASVSLNGAEWNRWRRFAWTTERDAETLEKIAVSLEQASKASSLGHDSTTIDFWKKAIEREKAAENYYKEAFQAHTKGNDSAWVQYTNAAHEAKKSAEQFKNLATYSQEAIEADALNPGSPIAVVLRKALKKITSAAELYFQAEQAYLENNEAANNHSESAFKKINEADKYLNQAKEIRKANKISIATIPSQIHPEDNKSRVIFEEKVQSKSSTDIDNLKISGEDSEGSSQEEKIDPTTYLERVLEYAKSLAALSKDKTERQNRFHLAVEHYQSAINDLDQEKNHQTVQNLKPAELSASASQQSRKAADYLTTSAEKLLGDLRQPGVGQQSEITFFEAAEHAIKSAASFRDAASHWINIKIASERGDDLGIQHHQQLLENSEAAAGLYARAADYRKNRQPNEATLLQEAAEACEKKIKYYADHYEAVNKAKEEQLNQTISYRWHEIDEKCQLALTRWNHVFESYASMKQETLEEADNSKRIASVIEDRIQAIRKRIDSLSSPKAGPKVIYSKEGEGSQQGNRRRITIIKKEAINPYVRHEEEFDAAGKKVGEAEMIADQLLVRLKDDLPETQGKFLADLNHPEAWLEKILSSEPLFVLHFLPKGSSITATTAEEILNMMTILLEKIKTNRSAVHSEPNFFFDSLTEPNDPYYPDQWNLKDFFGITPPSNLFDQNNPTILPPVHSTIVAVIDSGINHRHEDLQENMWKSEENEYGEYTRGFNALGDDEQSQSEVEDNKGHGTLVSGIIGAVCNNNKGIAGIAGMPGIVRLMPCLSSNQNTKANTESILKCIEFAREKEAKILNCSFGQKAQSFDFPQGFSSQNIQLLKDALSNEGKDNHVIVVCAAGNKAQNNDHPNECVYPASYSLPNLIAVAATSQRGTLAKKFSNYGKRSVHIAAPGVLITSTTIPPSYPPYTRIDNGTSYAAPHVAAALALLRAKFPHLADDIPALIGRLLATTDPLVKLVTTNGVHDVVIDNQSIATGRLNLKNALRNDLLGKFGCIDDLAPLFSEKYDLYEEESQKARNAIEIRKKADQAAIIAEFAKEHILDISAQKKLPWKLVFQKAHEAREAWWQAVTNNWINLNLARNNQENEKIKLWWKEELCNAETAYQRQIDLKNRCVFYKEFSQQVDAAIPRINQELNAAISASQAAFRSTATKKKKASLDALQQWKNLRTYCSGVINQLDQRLSAVPATNHQDQTWREAQLQKVKDVQETVNTTQKIEIKKLNEIIKRL